MGLVRGFRALQLVLGFGHLGCSGEGFQDKRCLVVWGCGCGHVLRSREVLGLECRSAAGVDNVCADPQTKA